MACETCTDLLGEYEAAVKLYTMAIRDMAGLVGTDFMVALEKLELLRGKCQDANDAMTTHWRQEHGDLRHKAASA